jgi:hypothetical protein
MSWTGTHLIPYSYTRLKDYERCPFYAYQVHALKNRGPQSQYAARGDLIHKQAENYVNAVQGTKRIVPPALANYEVPLKAIVAAGGAQTELSFGVTAKWTQTEFFGKDVWCRGKWDLVVLEEDNLRVIDHKTGKVYPETADQLRLYAAAAFAYAPKAPKVTAEAWHLDQPVKTGLQAFELLPADVKMVRKDFEKRVQKMGRDTKLDPKPNQYCYNCHLSKKKDGPCPVA